MHACMHVCMYASMYVHAMRLMPGKCLVAELLLASSRYMYVDRGDFGLAAALPKECQLLSTVSRTTVRKMMDGLDKITHAWRHVIRSNRVMSNVNNDNNVQ